MVLPKKQNWNHKHLHVTYWYFLHTLRECLERNWYIFLIIFMYFDFYFTFLPVKEKKKVRMSWKSLKKQYFYHEMYQYRLLTGKIKMNAQKSHNFWITPWGLTKVQVTNPSLSIVRINKNSWTRSNIFFRMLASVFDLWLWPVGLYKRCQMSCSVPVQLLPS